MANLATDVINYLVARGIATQQGLDVFRGYLPDDVASTAFAVIETGGMDADVDLPLKDPTFQVLIRSETYDAGKNKLDSIRDALHQFRGQVLGTGTIFFHFIYALAEGGYIGRDERGRDMFSINFHAKTR